MKFKSLVIFCCSILISCAHLPTDTSSGLDQNRSGAQELVINTQVQDDLNVRGDATDWKFITIPEDGIITIHVEFFDKEVVGELLVLGSNGYLQTMYNTSANDIIDLLVFKGAAGKYYLKVSLTSGKSDYSLKATFNPEPNQSGYRNDIKGSSLIYTQGPK